MSREVLTDGLARLGLALEAAQVDQLLAYLALLQKWNRVYNLTAVREPAEMLTHHLLDSLAAIGPLQRQTAGRPMRLLDVGSGGGLPGVVIAIACPGVAVTCVDTVGKKAAFIQQAAATLQLANLRGEHARVEALRAEEGGGFDVICSRAFASLADFTTWSRQALSPGGAWMAMKGKHPADEIAALPLDVSVFHVEPLAVPGLNAERCIVWLKPLARCIR
jgi:16S rRNA (guanine527-N7)-methyltransferase